MLPEPIEGDAQLQIGRMLPLLLDLTNFVNRARLLVQNLMRQLASLYHAQQKVYPFRQVHLQTVFEYLGMLLTVLITLDELVLQNPSLSGCLSKYLRMVKAIKGDPARYQADSADKMDNLEKLLLEIKGHVMDGHIFSSTIQQQFDFPGMIEVQKNRMLKDEFFLNVKTLFLVVSSKIGESTEYTQRSRLPGIYGLYAMYMFIWKDPSDKKLFKDFWNLFKTVPVVHLGGNLSWDLTKFLNQHIPFMRKLIKKDPRKEIAGYLSQLDKEFKDRVTSSHLQASIWMVRMESNLTNRADVMTMLNSRTSLLTQGLILATNVATLFKTVIALHLELSVPLKADDVRSLMECVELLKAVQATFHRRSAMLGESLALMIQKVQTALQTFLVPVKAKLESLRQFDAIQLDVLAAVNLAMTMLNGPATSDRRILLRLAIHVIFQMNLLREVEIEEVKVLLRKLEMITELQKGLLKACSCDFLFWNRELIPTYFRDIYRRPEKAHMLQYIFSALQDIQPSLAQIVHEEPQKFVELFEKEILDALEEHIIDPLARDIETDLRFHIHSHLKVSDRDPFKKGVVDIGRFVKLKPIRFFAHAIDIRGRVSHYLDRTFYNLNTVALHDWKTYSEMRKLAEDKYGLQLIETHLPGATLEQGLDVLMIMRNIHIFVARYHYNLNNQIFVEKESENKTLNTINIIHIANSIRTHGTGIMNTTVNYTYKFLRQKFNIFSQFLFDDHIKSRLFKDIRFFKQNAAQLDTKYPYERADKFTKDIRKLGLTKAGLSFLDQFRILITQIGNAMGYIRMIRSGGLYYIANAIKFVPDLGDIPSFSELVEREKLPPETQLAGKNLDAAIGNLHKNFEEGTQYFKLLVQVFAEQFRNPNNLHLKNFYAIVPPLTINFIEHLMLGKQRMLNRSQALGSASGALFTDDGFAMGLAYILRLLDQNAEFNSLHWFSAVRARYETEAKRIESENRGKSKEEQQTVALTKNKLNDYLREFELLYYSLNGAQIFFKETEKQPEPESEASGSGAEESASAPSSDAPPPSQPVAAAGPPPPAPPPPGDFTPAPINAAPPPPPPPPPF